MGVVKLLKSFCSWSGGKDSCLALYYALNEGFEVEKLLTMLTEKNQKSRSHGLNREVLRNQASSLGISLQTCPTSWDNYEENFLEVLHGFRQEGIKHGIFGDIDIVEHREWVKRVCSGVGMEAHLPLWGKTRSELLHDFIESGFKAIIVTVKEDALGKEFLGKIITKDLIEKFIDLKIDPSGENGEYHTLVCDGPIFDFPLNICKNNILSHKGYSFLEIQLNK